MCLPGFATEGPTCRSALRSNRRPGAWRNVSPAEHSMRSVPVLRDVAPRLAAFCGFPDAVRDGRLTELDFGVWEMRRWDDLRGPDRTGLVCRLAEGTCRRCGVVAGSVPEGRFLRPRSERSRNGLGAAVHARRRDRMPEGLRGRMYAGAGVRPSRRFRRGGSRCVSGRKQRRVPSRKYPAGRFVV